MNSKIKDSMLSLDIYAWLKENLEKIEGGFIKKIYQIGEKEFLIKIYKNETRNLYVNLNGWLYFDNRDVPEKPSMFAMFLRKRFSSKRIKRVEQINFDRIVRIDCDDYSLILELFGGGNVIVLKDNLIERAYIEREWKNRSILKGHYYAPPPAKKNPITDIEDICNVINSSKYDIVRAIAIEYNIGRYAEEVCIRANVDKNNKKVNDEECQRIKKAIGEIFVFSGGYIYDNFFSPVPLKMESEERSIYKDFNECIKKYAEKFKIEEGEESKKLKRIKGEQEKLIKKFVEEGERMRKIGDKIYEHFGEIEEMIEKARRGEIEYNRKNGMMKVKFDTLEFDVNVKKSPGDNASYYYNMAKKLKEKVKRAKEKEKEIEEKIKNERKKRKKKEKKRKKFWFEKYRWFISSEGILVIGGRDAKTNEEVVKKHMGDKDIYMHADIHGAPSIVIKSEGKEIGEKTLNEAAQFAVSMSKAWNAGIGNLSAYWVYPSQVSKMGESGEYVAKGAWVIHGKRNYIHKVPLILAVGIVKIDGDEILMCAPEDAVRVKTEKYILIFPGDMKKEGGAKIIAKEFSVSVDEVMRILPPGKIKIESHL